MASQILSDVGLLAYSSHRGSRQIGLCAKRRHLDTSLAPGEQPDLVYDDKGRYTMKNGYKKVRTGIRISELLNVPTDQIAKSNRDNKDRRQVDNRPVYLEVTGTGGDSNRDEESIYSWNSQMEMGPAQLSPATAEQQKPSGDKITSNTAMPNTVSPVSSGTATPASLGPYSPTLADIKLQQAILRKVNLIYHEVIGACACLGCMKILLSSGVIRHLEDIHQYPLTTIKIIRDVIPTLPGLRYSRGEKQRLPKRVVPALEGILVEQGYHCQYCSAAFRCGNSMKKHLRVNHPDGHKEWFGKALPKGPIQSLSMPSTGGGKWRGASFQVTVDEGMEIKMAYVPRATLGKAMERGAKKVKKLSLAPRARERG
ncbi:MAG: hypothetical protein M1839_008062 [Geoglossum umbratile]|nr:MAG: hypothetical protein M1839_008062 [Geoglossum umbratile]